MHLGCFGSSEHGPHVYINCPPHKADLVRTDVKSIRAGVRKNLTQLAGNLTQHGPGLGLGRLAPEQADQSLACLKQRVA